MSQRKKKIEYTTIRVPVAIKDELRCLAIELAAYYESCGNIEQQKKLRLVNGMHERFGVALWKVIERLLHQDRLLKNRRKQSRHNKQRKGE